MDRPVHNLINAIISISTLRAKYVEGGYDRAKHWLNIDWDKVAYTFKQKTNFRSNAHQTETIGA